MKRSFIIGFSRNKKGKIFSVLLQRYMKKQYSHVFIKYNTKEHLGDNAIYHSSLSGGVSYMCETKFLEKNEEVRLYAIEIPDNQYINIRNELFKECGDSYGIWQNVGILIVDFIRSCGIKIKNPFTKGQNCSELVYKDVVCRLFPEEIGMYDPQTVRPDHIENILKKHNITTI